ncbi:MAG: DNA (cytosine-5-)-methyltransferase [Acidimicrobiales bacterium]|nr:DNA (cytosine-5-)-methyltransferase [Acidimicrobiales bacterium]
MSSKFTTIEVCAGAGGQSIGLHRAGFSPVALVEIDKWACRTLRTNRPSWKIYEGDATDHALLPRGLRADLLAGGVPCPPFSRAGKQLGLDDERDLLFEMTVLAERHRPSAVLIENVRGLLDRRFDDYRSELDEEFRRLGYVPQGWRLLNASQFGVPQLRPRAVFVAMVPKAASHFAWPTRHRTPKTVGEALGEMMAEGGWPGAAEWAGRANRIAPTLVGGSKKHGGPDLGPTRAKREWADLGVNGLLLANEAPGPDFPADGMPCLTTEMVAVLQGFPKSWRFEGPKTHRYRQVGNAFPPPVAAAVGRSICSALEAASTEPVETSSDRAQPSEGTAAA